MRILLLAAAAAVVIGGGTTIASAQTYKAAMAASNNAFDDVVKADIAKGYYTQAQGDELLRQVDASLVRLDEATNKFASRVTKTITLASSGNLRDVVGQVGVMLDRNGGFTMGGTDSQVREQSAAIYNAIDASLQTSIAIQEDLRPMLNEYGAELDRIVAARAGLILASPNASATDKGKVRSESARVSDKVRNSFERSLQADLYKIETVRDQLQARRDVVIANISGDIRRNSAEYGSDWKKWPKPKPSGLSSTAANAPGTGYAAGMPPGSSAESSDDEIVIVSKYDRTTGAIISTRVLNNPSVESGRARIETDSNGTPIGYSNLIGGGPDASGGSLSIDQLRSMLPPSITIPADLANGPYSNADINGGSFATVYRGYIVRPGENGTTIIAIPSTQVERPSSLMTAPSNQIQVPSGMIAMPSNQITVPGSQITVPSTQVRTPGSAMNSLDLQPALCGR
ncbi:hypothetical protein U1839_23035 [Sphingomonas sp. RT2P30]|uniref:hypothetical protein n=1 Tax=Parasphingomonas halimpatiens TaxID=3096162 RepID=UPI002FC713A1